MRDRPEPRSLYRKVREHGLRWLIWRFVQEGRSPQYGISKRVVQALRRLSPSLGRQGSHGRARQFGDRLTACYTLTDHVTSYDFAYFLVAADVTARRAGLKGFSVALIRRDLMPSSNTSQDDDLQGRSNFEWRLNNIVKPLADYYPSCLNVILVDSAAELSRALEGQTTYPERYSWNYYPTMDYREVFELADQGLHLGFRAPEKSFEFLDNWLKVRGVSGRFLTITLRQRRWDSRRNSNVAAWVAFARWAQGQEIAVVFIPDTDVAVQPDPSLEEFLVFEPACWNMGLRIAALQTAYVNLGVNNGPMALAMLTPGCPYIQFWPDHGVGAHKNLRESSGLTPGAPHIPGASANQLTIWCQDEAPVIIESFLRWQGTCQSDS